MYIKLINFLKHGLPIVLFSSNIILLIAQGSRKICQVNTQKAMDNPQFCKSYEKRKHSISEKCIDSFLLRITLSGVS